MSDDRFRVHNFYRGSIAGKSMHNAQRMAIKYIENHLGKPIEIINTDCEKIQTLEAKVKELEKENVKLRECVEFYANKKNWVSWFPVDDKWKIKESDRETMGEYHFEGHHETVGGKKARETLKELEGGE